MLRFTDIAGCYAAGALGCDDAAELLGISPRTFLRWRDRHAETGTASWTDKRVGKVSPRKAADAENAYQHFLMLQHPQTIIQTVFVPRHSAGLPANMKHSCHE